MKPKPLSALNHFTVPVAISSNPFSVCLRRDLAAPIVRVSGLSSENQLSRATIFVKTSVTGRAVAAQQFGEGGEFSGQSGPSRTGYSHPGPGPAARVTLLHLDHSGLLQHGQVLGQVAGRQAEGVAQVAELGPLRFGGDVQYAEPVPLVNSFVDSVGRMLPGGRVGGGVHGRPHATAGCRR